MSWDTLWGALGLFLVFEGLLPFANPQGYQRMLTKLLEMKPGQVRYFGLCSIGAGVLLLLILT